jgi:hypothetical protein
LIVNLSKNYNALKERFKLGCDENNILLFEVGVNILTDFIKKDMKMTKV